MTDLLAAQKCALEAAELASIEIIKAYYSSVSEYDTKSTDMDLVTKTDVLCQSIIIEHLKAFNNNFKFISEEIEDEIVLDDTPTWIIDPIDGTTNFVHRYPFVAVAICLAINKQPTVGVVVCPILGEKYTAIRGQGAFKFDAHSPQGRPISVSPIVDISKSIISTNYSYDRTDTGINSVNKRLYELLVRKVHGVRVTGSGVIVC
jgi:fructose-1,6-bisphosphatase/inositol monophosphatase family enzyme